MEIKLRQRLIGAVVLIALAVIFLPEFFKGAKPEAKQKVVLDAPLPSESPKTTTQIVMPEQDNTSISQGNSQASTPMSNQPQQSIAANQAAELGASVAVPSLNNTTKGSVSNPNQLAFGSEQAQTFTPPTSVETSVQPKEITKPKTQAKQKIKLATTKKSVSVNPQDSLRYAQQAVQAEMANLTDVKPSVTAVASESGDSSAWVVQLGSFSSAVNAKKLVNELRANGFAAHLRTSKASGGSMTRVYVGPEVKRAAADSLRSSLARDLHLKGVVVAFDTSQN